MGMAESRNHGPVLVWLDLVFTTRQLIREKRVTEGMRFVLYLLLCPLTLAGQDSGVDSR